MEDTGLVLVLVESKNIYLAFGEDILLGKDLRLVLLLVMF